MITYQTTAHAKLNLSLDVVSRRPDGYHDLKMIMQEISLGDNITLTLGTGEPWRVLSGFGEIPCDDSNLCIKAARRFFEATGLDPHGLTVEIEKLTPVCAGMGGGSADGAAVLRLLQQHYGSPLSQETLYQIGERVGSDVPFALFGGTALAQEKGQVLTRLAPMPSCHIVLCKPPFPISTPKLFQAIDSEVIDHRPQTETMVAAIAAGDLSALAEGLCNVFEPVVARDHDEIGRIKALMMESGALGSCMTGSGPTVFGIFEELSLAEACAQRLKADFSDTYLVHPV